MLKKIALGALALLLAFLAFVATRPSTFRVERAATMRAPAAKIHAVLSDFQQWRAWSPWENIDPDMKRTYSGTRSGLGATYAWEGNSNVGSGSMEIVEDTPQRLVMRLDFLSPFEAHNTAQFDLTPEGDATRVSWAMDGNNNFLGKLMSLFFDMDEMVGGSFETGLANLKKLVEM